MEDQTRLAKALAVIEDRVDGMWEKVENGCVPNETMNRVYREYNSVLDAIEKLECMLYD